MLIALSISLFLCGVVLMFLYDKILPTTVRQSFILLCSMFLLLISSLLGVYDYNCRTKDDAQYALMVESLKKEYENTIGNLHRDYQLQLERSERVLNVANARTNGSLQLTWDFNNPIIKCE